MAVGTGIGPLGTIYHPRMVIHKLLEGSTADGTGSGKEMKMERFRTGLVHAVQTSTDSGDIASIKIEGSFDDTTYIEVHDFGAINTAGQAGSKSAVVTLFPFMRAVQSSTANTPLVTVFLGE